MSTEPVEVPKVLIVEDEMILHSPAVDFVEDAGFCPVEAVNADETISILESRSDISLLFTNIQMSRSVDGPMPAVEQVIIKRLRYCDCSE